MFSVVKKPTISGIHHVSFLSGPALSFLTTSVIFIVPQKNGMLEPDYWYEYFIYGLFTLFPLFMLQVWFQIKYWCEFTFSRKSMWKVSFLAFVINYSVLPLYFCIWTYALEFVPPMAFGMYIGGTIAFMFMIVGIWFE